MLITPFRWPRSILNVLLLRSLMTVVKAGCYDQGMCCSGRNLSCKSTERDADRAVTSAESGIRLVTLGGHQPPVYTKGHEMIGRLILPDLIELDESAADYAHEFARSGYLTAYDAASFENDLASGGHQVTRLVFGRPVESEPLFDKIRSHRGKPIVRYSLLNKYIPLKVGRVSKAYGDPTGTVRVIYLTDSESACYCDEQCMPFGDCCSDYFRYCAPQSVDCDVSPWTSWSACQPTNGSCGEGSRMRLRHVVRNATGAGQQCPDLSQTVACFKDCHAEEKKDITTVALLLDYRYNGSRVHNRELLTGYEKLSDGRHINYCVQYKLGWVNRNCVERKWKAALRTGRTICGECQPEAQVHRNTPRCASDLDDGEKGFWKLVGPPSCNGIWTRISRLDHCQCSVDLPHLHPFLMV